MSQMTNLEKETVFIFNEQEKTAIIDTFNSKLQNDLQRFAEEHPDKCKLLRQHETGNKCYEVPKAWIKVKAPMKLTEQQKAERAARMNRLREAKEAARKQMANVL